MFAIGIHPHRVTNPKCLDDMGELERMVKGNRVVALGEVGIDFAKHPLTSVWKWQGQLLEAQAILAVQVHLPILIHCRENENENAARVMCMKILEAIVPVQQGWCYICSCSHYIFMARNQGHDVTARACFHASVSAWNTMDLYSNVLYLSWVFAKVHASISHLSNVNFLVMYSNYL